MSRRWIQLLTLASILCGTSSSFAAGPPRVIELWHGPAPEEPGTIGPERVRMSPRLERRQVEVTEPTRMITDVTIPTITIHSPTNVANTGTAVLIFPGGGYWDLYWELEGEEVAAWLNSLGITGVIVKYRVPRRPDEIEGEPARRPLQDAQRALRIVRSRASEFDIDPSAHRRDRFLRRRASRHRHGDQFREAHVRTDRRPSTRSAAGQTSRLPPTPAFSKRRTRTRSLQDSAFPRTRHRSFSFMAATTSSAHRSTAW